MKSNIFLRVIIVLFCFFFILPAQATTLEDEASLWVKDKGGELLKAFSQKDLAAKYAKLDEMLVSCIDLNYVSKFVVGKYWRQMTPEQQKQYQSLFTRYALSIYKAFPLDFDTEAINFEVVKISQNKDKINVRIKLNVSSVTQQENSILQDIFVDFILHYDNEQIKIIDLKLGESSLILSYRSRFYEMFAKDDDDIDWFLEDLSDITSAAERTNEDKLYHQYHELP